MLSRVEFYNYCQFAEAAFDFTPGVNIIVGPNGSGKSTIMNGIYGIITGDWSRASSSGKQKNEDNIYWHATEKARSGGRLTLSNQWVMERNIRPNSRKLVIPGVEKPVIKDGEIDDKFFELFGLSSQVLRDFVIVAQEGVKNVLTMTPQDRLKMFIKAFQLDRFEDIYNALDKESSSDRTILAETRPDITVLQAQFDKVKVERDQFLAQPPVVIPQVNPDVLGAIVFAYNTRNTSFNKVNQYKSELDACENALKTITKVVGDMQAEVKGMEDYIAANKDEITGYAASLSQHDKAKSVTDVINIDRLSLNRETEQHNVLTLNSPLPPSGPPRAKLEENLAKAREKVTTLYGPAKLSADIRKLGTAVCPTCQQAIAGVVNPQAEEAWEKAKQEVKTLELEVGAWFMHDKKVLQHSNDLKNSEDRKLMLLEKIRKGEESLKVGNLIVLEEGAASAFRVAVDAFKKMEFDLQSKRTTLQVAESGKVKEQEGVNEAHKRWATALEEYRKLPNASEANNAEAQLNNYRRAQEEDLRRKEAAVHIERAFNDANQALKTAQEYLDSRARRQSWVDRSNILREAFHRNNVPRQVLGRKVQKLGSAVIDFLSNFAVPFIPSFTDDMDILCNFNDGKVMPVSRLSPGQKVALALSYRLAQHKGIAPKVDFICLDEPADGLDKNNRQRLNLMLPTLRTISHQNNIQFILITHDEIPEGIVDNVIRLREQV